MAAGDITISRNVGHSGLGRYRIEGTVEVDNTRRAFEIGGTKVYVHSFVVTGAGEDVPMVEIDLNENASGTSTVGTVALKSALNNTDTLSFYADVTM